MPGSGELPGAGRLLSEPSLGEQQQELQLMRRWELLAPQCARCKRRCCAGNSLREVRVRHKVREQFVSVIKQCFSPRPWLPSMISAAPLLDAVAVIKVFVSLAAGLVSAGLEAFPAVVTRALCCLWLPELGWGLAEAAVALLAGFQHEGTHTGAMSCSGDPPW